MLSDRAHGRGLTTRLLVELFEVVLPCHTFLVEEVGKTPAF